MMRAASLVLVAFALASTLRAQERGPIMPAPVPITAAAVVMKAAPRSYNVVSVPVPQAIARDVAIAYEVETQGDVPLLGRRAGSMSAAERRPVLLTIGVPADVRAGRLLAAQVVFRGMDGAFVVVPVELDVAPEYQIALNAPPRIAGMHAGDPVEVPVRVRNDGNVVDTLTLEVEAPAGWHLRGGATSPVVVLPGITHERVLLFAIDRTVNTGDFFLTVRLLRNRAEVTRQVVMVQVGERAARSSDGPELRTALASVLGSDIAPTHVLQLDARGPLTGDIRMDARAALEVGSGDGLARRGLSGIGSHIYAPELTLWSERWRGTLGYTDGNFSALAGQSLAGRGASLRGNTLDGAWQVEAGRALRYGGEQDAGAVVGGSWRGRYQGYSVRAAAAHATDALDAFSVGAGRTLPVFGDVVLETGYRSYADGSGFGIAAHAQRELGKGRYELRLAHAPGGSSAYARAEDEFGLSGRQSVGERLTVGGGVYHSADANASFGRVRNRTLNLYQNYQLSDRILLTGQLLNTQFNARTDALAMGHGETTLQLGALSTGSTLYYSGDIYLGRTTRTLEIGQDEGRTQGGRAGGHAQVSLLTTRAVMQLDGGYERAIEGGGYLPEMVTLGASFDRLEFGVAGTILTLAGGVTHRRFGALRDPATTMRASASMPLPQGLRFSMAFERDPFFTAGTGSRPWTIAARIERSFVLPRIAAGGAEGTVFEDRNGNGVRDTGERGVPNVTVRHAGVSGLTDAAGHYFFWRRTDQPVTIDPLSLPFGWLAMQDSANPRRRELPLVPTGSVELRLEIVADANGRKPDVDLAPVNVTAIDPAGRRWLARRASTETAVFEALPVGTYALELDFSAASEPLRPRAGELKLEVNSGVTQQTVQLIGRPLRFRSGGS